MAAPFRIRAVDAVESALPGTTRPAGFEARTARPGVASTFAWWVAFYSEAGKPIAGGSATLQWYGVNVETDGTVTTPEIGGAVAAAALVTKTVTVAAGVWPWPRLTAITPPVVAAKSIRVSIDDNADGDYSITVDEEDPVTYAAVGKTATEIRDGLVAGFAAHPTASAAADGAIELVITLDTAGLDFELVLEGPVEDAMSQAEETPVLPVAATARLFMVESQAAGVDVDALAAAVVAAVPTAAEVAAEVDAEGGAAAAIAAASLPSAADVATAVGAQAACAAAIDAKLGDIAAAVAVEVPDASVIEALVSPPATGPFKAGPLTGSTSYVILAAVPGQVHTLYGYKIAATNKGAVATWVSGVTDLTAPFNVPNGDTAVLAPGSRKSLVCGTNEALVLEVTDPTATVDITYWARTAAP
jgi:hypothetical protein